MKSTIGIALLALLCTSTAPASTPVSVASGDWSNIPRIHVTGALRISTDAIDQIEAAAIGECARPGQSKRRVSLTIPFIIQFSPQGDVQRVVIQRLNCPTIEKVAGGAVLQMARDGAYRPTGENQEGWYRGEISISSH